MAEVDINLKKLSNEVTLIVDFNITNEFYLRLIIAKFLIWLAVKVLNCSVEFRENG